MSPIRNPLLMVVALLAIACSDGAADRPRPTEPAPADDPDFRRLGPPKPGEWLYEFPEKGQSFEAYVASDPVRADEARNALAFVPVGERVAQFDAAVEFAGLWFGLPTRALPLEPLPETGWQRSRDGPAGAFVQYQTDWFLNRLLPPLVPDDAVCLLAISAADLYPEESWNFVFGMSTFARRVAVCSFVRYGAGFWGGEETPDTRRLALLRSLKVVTHEIGHAFGLRHCVVYACDMNGSNSLRESDSRPLVLCPDCLRKLEWNLGFDVAARYRALRDFYEEHDLGREAAFAASRARKLSR